MKPDIEVFVLEKEKDVIVCFDTYGPTRLSDIARLMVGDDIFISKVYHNHNWSSHSSNVVSTLPNETRPVVVEESHAYYKITPDGVANTLTKDEYCNAIYTCHHTLYLSPKQLRDQGYRAVRTFKVEERPTYFQFDTRYKNPELLSTQVYHSGLEDELIMGSSFYLDNKSPFFKHFQIKVRL